MPGAQLDRLGLVQVSYATTDVRASARRWRELFGAGPFFVREHVALERVVVDGGEGMLDHTVALGQCGDILVEFVQHHRAEPPALADDMRLGRPGLHHVACFVSSLERARDELVASGGRVVMQASTKHVRFMFVDLGPDVGHLVELHEDTPHLVELYARVREASIGWDGSDPIRELR